MIKIAIIDDHAMLRAGLRLFLSDQPGLHVVAEGRDGREALAIAKREVADVLVMDLAMPGQSGVDALAAIRAHSARLPVLILSSFPETHYAVRLLRQGASGYLNKGCEPDDIATAIRTVARGHKYLPVSVAELLANAIAMESDRPFHDQLSPREFQVFLGLAKGETVTQVAQGMSVSAKTVSTYRTRVMEKMQLESNSALTYSALKEGLIQ